MTVSGVVLVVSVKKMQGGQDPREGSMATNSLVFYCFTLGLNILSTGSGLYTPRFWAAEFMN
ncbi:hypothetical protein V5O48_003152 [Marasmius crinis-equi]|uniref:Uncharacterized protein n=1 Tax=Marasmius crinis-equi TaxID=585013 RepID=A0ABR3FTK7_9AGAR